MKASKTSSMCRTFRFSVLLWFVAFLDCFSTSAFSSITWTVCSDCLITGEEAGRSEASDLRIRQGHYNTIWKLLKHLPLVSDLDELGLPSVSISVAPSWDWFVTIFKKLGFNVTLRFRGKVHTSRQVRQELSSVWISLKFCSHSSSWYGIVYWWTYIYSIPTHNFLTSTK